MTAFLTEIFLFLVIAACKQRSTSYVPKRTSRRLFCTPFCAYLHPQLENTTFEASGVVADSHSRPADILHPIWSCGRPAALDIHVISPLQELTFYAASSSPGHAQKVGMQSKLADPPGRLPCC